MRVSSAPVGTIPRASDVTDDPNPNSKPEAVGKRLGGVRIANDDHEPGLNHRTPPSWRALRPPAYWRFPQSQGARPDLPDSLDGKEHRRPAHLLVVPSRRVR